MKAFNIKSGYWEGNNFKLNLNHRQSGKCRQDQRTGFRVLIANHQRQSIRIITKCIAGDFIHWFFIVAYTWMVRLSVHNSLLDLENNRKHRLSMNYTAVSKEAQKLESSSNSEWSIIKDRESAQVQFRNSVNALMEANTDLLIQRNE